MGGQFERMAQTVKTCSATSQRKLLMQRFITVLKQCEAIITNHTLTYQQAGDTKEPLTPSYLLRMRTATLFLHLHQFTDIQSEKMDNRQLRNQYYMLSTSLNCFHKNWEQEYLTALREQHKNIYPLSNRQHMIPGDLVTARVREAPQLEWPLAEAIRTFPDDVGVVRSTESEVNSQLYKHPIEHTVPLKLSCKRESKAITGNDNNKDDNKITNDNPQRKIPTQETPKVRRDQREGGITQQQ